MNEGDEGSETKLDARPPLNGGWIDKPFMFLRRGEGDVMGLSRLPESFTVRLFIVEGRFIVDGRPPKWVAGNEFRGIRLTGESGEEDGDGSEREEVSVVKVVVGDESADSEFWVDVLSWCRCEGSGNGRSACCCDNPVANCAGAQDGSKSISLESTIVTNPLSSILLSASGSNMDINEGIWSSYSRLAVADGIF